MAGTRNLSYLLKPMNVNVGLIGAGNLAINLAKGFVRAGMFKVIWFVFKIVKTIYNCTNKYYIDWAL